MKNEKLFFLKLLMFAFAIMLSCNQSKSITSNTENLVAPNLKTGYAKKETSLDSLNENDFNIFSITTIGNSDKVEDIEAFVSLSDVYRDSLAIPSEIISNQKNISFKNLKFFELSSPYRNKLLNATKIMETDTLFLYDYGLNELVKIEVKELKAVAHLTPYASEGEQIFEGDYMIGFKVDKEVMRKSAAAYFRNVIVYIGSKNPFAQRQLKLAKWQKINEQDFPKPFLKKDFNSDGFKAGNHYSYKNDTITCYVRDILLKNSITKRHFIALGKSGKNIVSEKMFSESEGTSLAPLNFVDNNEPNAGEQWIGKLFKNKPPVIFGFEYHSFGCPSIILLEKDYTEISINCDNRH